MAAAKKNANPTEKKSTSTKKPPQSKDVVAEIRRRSKAGQSLASGSNRKGWLYPAALRLSGSWKAAVEEAGFNYGDIKRRNLTKADLLRRIQALAAEGIPLRGTQHPLLYGVARRLCGDWKKAVKAAHCKLPGPYKWTTEALVARIQQDIAEGLPVNSAAVVGRNWALYQAGRRRFGSWGAALEAVPAAAK